MWMINVCCCICLYSYIIIHYLADKSRQCLRAVIFGYFCCPVFKMGTFAINGTYFISMILFVMCAMEYKRNKIRVTQKVRYFILFEVYTLVLMVFNGFMNGIVNRGILVSFAGQMNIAIGILGCTLLYQLAKDPMEVLIRAIMYANIFHFLMGIFQLLSAEMGYFVTYQLYAYEGRQGPLNVTRDIGAFQRIFGASYSPTILGAYILVSIAFLMAVVLTGKAVKMEKILLLLALSLVVGLMAFSKTVIIGIFIIFFIEIVWCAFHMSQCNKRYLFWCASIIAGGFLLVTAVAFSTRLWGQVQYYFGKILQNPLAALSTRYGNGVLESSSDILSNAAALSKYENTSYLTVALIKEHPFMGVGLLPVASEFIGDSQYITVLHHGGIVLFLLYMLFYGNVCWEHFREKRMIGFSVMIAIGLCGISANILETASVCPFLGFCLAYDRKNVRSARSMITIYEGKVS